MLEQSLEKPGFGEGNARVSGRHAGTKVSLYGTALPGGFVRFVELALLGRSG